MELLGDKLNEWLPVRFPGHNVFAVVAQQNGKSIGFQNIEIKLSPGQWTLDINDYTVDGGLSPETVKKFGGGSFIFIFKFHRK